MIPTSADHVRACSYELDILHMKDQIQTLQFEFRFLKMFFWCLPTGSARKIRATIRKAKQGLHSAGVRALDAGEFKDWDLLVSNLQEKFENVKPKIRKICLHLLDCSWKRKFSTRIHLLQFIDCILSNLKDLVILKVNLVSSVKMQIGVLEQRLRFLRDFAQFTKRCIDKEELKVFRIHVLAWAHKTAYVSYLCLVDGTKEGMASRMNCILADVLKMIKPCTPEAAGMYLGLLKSLNVWLSESVLTGEIVARFVDFLLDSTMVSMKNSVRTLREGIILLISFLTSPSELVKPKKLIDIKKQRDAIVSEVVSLICSLSVQEMKNNVLNQFLIKTDKIKAKIRKLYVCTYDQSRSNFPRTNVVGFIDSLLENLGNLKEKMECNSNLIPSVKHQIMIIQEELASLRPFLEGVLALQDEQKVLWMKIIDVVYQAEHAIDSCLIVDFPSWYPVISLSYVIKEIEFIKSKVLMIRDKNMQNTGDFGVEQHSSHILPGQASISRNNEVVVGFENEAKTIINKLTRGSKHLDIISIVGMAGIGKTTLAEIVYHDISVVSYFHKCAWCCVSQSYELRELLLAILDNISVLDGKFSLEAEVEELAAQLYRSLKGQRYLIVMDDIWDIKAWEELKYSFPDDINGSRIMFTSRIQNIAVQAKFGCYAHSLRHLSSEESLKLLQEKLKISCGIPPHLSAVAERILISCKGLPLAIVVVAGLLGREADNLAWWEHVAQHSELASEGYMGILQLSYEHLPNFLKPCFLYFGAFRANQVIKVRKLIQLWIAEGFIQRIGMRSLENVATEYLIGLIDRSLVVVVKKNVVGEIKECQIHDLLRELCLAKATKENFLYSAVDSVKFDQYRLCIHDKILQHPLELYFTSPSLRSLLVSSGGFFIEDLVGSVLKFLRVLDMENIHLGCHLPLELLSSILLRFLAINCNTQHIPSTISILQNLETFRIVSSCYVIHFPKSIWMMKKLRHVDVIGRGAAILSLGDDELGEFSQLDNMDSFSTLFFRNREETEEILKRLHRVRRLSFRLSATWGFSYNNCIEFPVLGGLNKLESLKMFFTKNVLHRCEFSFPSTLKKLTLSLFGRPWSEISAIGMLPNLEVLRLLFNAFVGQKWDVGDEQFLSLKYLKLKCSDIVEWSASINSFPRLEKLLVEDCFELEEIPSIFGDICTLKTLELRACDKAASSARQILEYQKEMGNEDLQVIITKSREGYFIQEPIRIFSENQKLSKLLSEDQKQSKLLLEYEKLSKRFLEYEKLSKLFSNQKQFILLSKGQKLSKLLSQGQKLSKLLSQGQKLLKLFSRCQKLLKRFSRCQKLLKRLSKVLLDFERRFHSMNLYFVPVRKFYFATPRNPRQECIRPVRPQDIFPSSTTHKKIDFTKVENKKRTKIKCKYNCQSRQAIIPRHCHQGVK